MKLFIPYLIFICLISNSSIANDINISTNNYNNQNQSITVDKTLPSRNTSYAYITTDTEYMTLYKCTINSDNMTFKDKDGNSTCVLSDALVIGQNANGTAGSGLYAHQVSVIGDFLYVLSINSGGTSWIQSCRITNDGLIHKCFSVYQAKTYMATSITSVTLRNGSYLYVGNANKEIKKLTVDVNAGTLTDDGDIYNGNDNGNVINAMYYNPLAKTLLFDNGPDSNRNYYLQYCNLNSDGTASNCANIKKVIIKSPNSHCGKINGNCRPSEKKNRK